MTKKIRRPKPKANIPSHWREWLKAFIIAIGFLIILRWFVFDLKTISDSSMEKAILAGDVVWVNKYQYGARMPMRILPKKWVDLFFTTDTLAPLRQLPYWRFPGYNQPMINDVVLINLPAYHQTAIDQRTPIAKRVAAQPGDEIIIKKGDIWVNNVKIPGTKTLQWSYETELKNDVVAEDFLTEYKIKEGSRARGRNRFILPFTEETADSLARNHLVRRIERHFPEKEKDFVYPFGDEALKWTPDNYGPIKLPYKGMKITMNPTNFDFYRYHILYHERQAITISNDSIFLEGKYMDTYTFKNDYYFMMGENRHNTSDSRLWGMVPESHIIGEVTGVFLSFDKDAGLLHKIRWKRCFTTIKKLSPVESE